MMAFLELLPPELTAPLPAAAAAEPADTDSWLAPAFIWVLICFRSSKPVIKQTLFERIEIIREGKSFIDPQNARPPLDLKGSRQARGQGPGPQRRQRQAESPEPCPVWF
ncbi:hypothetical protein AAFF_G00396270 [Aldrovandia affinis]|uniref:Uncharacterized protein n=1 Tax=Aldrovandia affinis TaxID=143900 RepID=A0AAD7SDW3_9TELE|nr:hypothetical protein AAFF_G00396270 [Aldrovandia affinis]